MVLLLLLPFGVISRFQMPFEVHVSFFLSFFLSVDNQPTANDLVGHTMMGHRLLPVMMLMIATIIEQPLNPIGVRS